jgi:hypothetical protein
MEQLPAEGGFHADFGVLVVDDEKDFLDTTVNRLHKRSIDAVGAASGISQGSNRLLALLAIKNPIPGTGQKLQRIYPHALSVDTSI